MVFNPITDPDEVKITSPGTEVPHPAVEVQSRPDWLPSKFTDPKDLAKSYTELEKRLGSAPSEYSLASADSWIVPDKKSVFDNFTALAKSKSVPQEVIDAAFSSFGNFLNEFNVDESAEMQKLGEGAQNRITTLKNWAQANFSESAFSALSNSITTADGIFALEEIRNKMLDNRTTVSTGTESTGKQPQTIEEIQQEVTSNYDKYKTDPAYRREITEKFERATNGQ